MDMNVTPARLCLVVGALLFGAGYYVGVTQTDAGMLSPILLLAGIVVMIGSVVLQSKEAKEQEEMRMHYFMNAMETMEAKRKKAEAKSASVEEEAPVGGTGTTTRTATRGTSTGTRPTTQKKAEEDVSPTRGAGTATRGTSTGTRPTTQKKAEEDVSPTRGTGTATRGTSTGTRPTTRGTEEKKAETPQRERRSSPMPRKTIDATKKTDSSDS